VKKIGLYFGSFNPIHNGHLAIAHFFKKNTDLHEIWLVVSPHNPLKDPATLAPQEHRLAMVNIGIAHSEGFCSSDVEFYLPTPSYTIQTLDKLSRVYPTYQFVVLMGEDSLASINKWKDYQRLLAEFDIYVFHRKESGILPRELSLSRVVFFKNAPLIPLSSTAIRAAIARGENVASAVPDGVANYIATHRLYLAT
jgi:nicotinate-nucleotide adenylyltransferase